MSYEVFARKYRPSTFDDVLGQDHVVRTLKNAIEQNRLAHAYLFVGPRGTGKTSLARIFSKALNAPNGPSIDFDPKDPVCVEIAEGRSIDVLEIDGATNRGIDHIRDLRDSVKYAPSSSSFKIYYIDEVHMLTKESFNALLKTLEEPPAHVKFIFATTEVDKILPTILSRCQRFDLRPITADVIAKQLLFIASQEAIDLEESAAHSVARGADGGMRDAQSMLDQLVSFCGEKITQSDVLDVFGFSSDEAVARLASSIISQNQADTLTEVAQHHTDGRDLGRILSDLVRWFRALLVAKVDPKSAGADFPEETRALLLEQVKDQKVNSLLKALEILGEAEEGMSKAVDKRIHFEIGVVKAARSFGEVSIDQIIKVLAGEDFSSNSSSTQEEPVAENKPITPTPVVPSMEKSVSEEPSQIQAEAAPVEQVESKIDLTKLEVPEEPEGFHEDPLVNLAMKEFDAKIVTD